MHPTPTRRRNGQEAIRITEVTCPTCEQPITAAKFAVIQGKLRAHDSEIERAAEPRFASREATIRMEAAAAATAALTEKISIAEQGKEAAEQQIKKLKAGQEASSRSDGSATLSRRPVPESLKYTALRPAGTQRALPHRRLSGDARSNGCHCVGASDLRGRGRGNEGPTDSSSRRCSSRGCLVHTRAVIETWFCQLKSR